MPRQLITPFLVLCGILAASSAFAADGQVLITHAKAVAGNVTPGDGAGYPVTLTRPGSYILGSNLTPGPGKNGIDAASPDITIDLNGFTISGGAAGGTNNGRYGIYDLGDRLTVKDGTIGAFRGVGVTTEGTGIYAPSRPYLIVENMRIINNNNGILVFAGLFARIQTSTIATNKFTGVGCGRSCHVEGNIVSGNLGDGIVIESGLALGNTIFSNGWYGIRGGSTVSNFIGFGSNIIVGNNNGGAQVSGVVYPLHPNKCLPVSC